MQLKIIGSNSAGNAYILESATEAILIECGVKFDKIKQAIGFNLRKIKGCFISHEHLDHCITLNAIMAAGIDVYATMGTAKARCIENHFRFYELVERAPYNVGEFRVMPFEVKHDAAQPVGFLIEHKECGRVLFLTDSFYCGYTFKGLNNIIVEANYCEQIIDMKLKEGANKFVRDRVIESHMSIQTCLQLLKANDLSAVNNIVLIHLSDNNSNAEDFKQQVQEQTGKNVVIADKGMCIDFNKTAF